ncbi:MAG: hypothetical protein FDX18_03640 [Chlorobium sp.]|nr:MAG: hypothetical protein FDX18_03640 [Chlorobium sp.]
MKVTVNKIHAAAAMKKLCYQQQTRKEYNNNKDECVQRTININRPFPSTLQVSGKTCIARWMCDG